MAEIIDVMTPKISECSAFTVNTALTNVPIVKTVPGSLITHYAGAGTSKFIRGDNFTILSVGVFVPERFVAYQYETGGGGGEISSPVLYLAGLPDGAALPIALFNVGANGQIRIPFFNYEMSMGVFTDTEENNFNAVTFELQSQYPFTSGLDDPTISMIDVPAALNGITFSVVPFIKVLHNTHLT